MKGQREYDDRHPEEDPFHNGIPEDIYDKAMEYWFARDVNNPSDTDILDMAYAIYEQEIRKCQR